ncbi:ankyrin repeat domain-containing protein [Pontibacter harenae]|uniref:ankyrin repeat domain-containing protein n=1 Tax=Pontibacter harenae TaxID=2894083 RepID=UPI001E48AD04|nr:ankyrin repeat domain-containing protein [Pontibacter harenae]MCC9168376.1 ankyrin repeat domain-containing protein [Pontibacter harenae]
MKKLLLTLTMVSVCQLIIAQTKPVTKSTSSKTVTTKPGTAAKPVSPAPASANTKPVGMATAKPVPSQDKNTRIIWRSAATQEGLRYYTSLKFKEAQEKFRTAIEEGDHDAYYFLGRMHQYRELKYDTIQIDSINEVQNAYKYFSASKDSARYYFQKAVDENSLLGHLGLAELMVLRTDEDKQRFLQHMRTAAVAIREKAVEGDAFSNRILGSMYYTGYGEMKDMGLAFNYLNRAALKNDVVAYTFLANMYLDEEGVTQDKGKAVEFLKKGIDAGDREATYTLGLLYEEGNLGEVKLDEARKLYRKAISKGSVSAYEQLKYMNMTPDEKLVVASITRSPDMMKRAFTAGADVNTLATPEEFGDDLRNRTPLMHAIYIPMLLEDYGVIYEPDVRIEMVNQLLERGAKINAQDADGKTALHFVVGSTRVRSEFFEQEQVLLLDILLGKGADPNMKDKEGNTALAQALQATIGQHIGIMELDKLISAGADPNITNAEGKTALMLACEMNANFEVIVALLQAGANVKALDNAGKAAIDYTKHENVQNILMAAGSPKREE